VIIRILLAMIIIIAAEEVLPVKHTAITIVMNLPAYLPIHAMHRVASTNVHRGEIILIEEVREANIPIRRLRF